MDDIERITLESVKAKLKEQGYGGLYYPGECGCGLDDLAPCGECRQEEGKEYINGCEPGYKHVDPRSKFGDWILSVSNEMPTEEEFDRAFSNC